MRKLFICFAVTLVSCNPVDTLDPYASAKEAASRDLRDPSSAEFRNLSRCFGNEAIVQGERNAKNAYGGYVGFENFWVWNGRVYTIENTTADEFTSLMASCSGMTVEEFRALRDDQ